MNDLLDSINEVDYKKVLRTAAATAAIGGSVMLGGKFLGVGDGPRGAPSVDKQAREIQKDPESNVAMSRDKLDAPLKINIDRIWDIESSKGTDPNMGKSIAGARGHFQFMESTWNELVKKMGKDWEWKTGSMDYGKSSQVADFYLNKEIPRLLKHFGHPDALTTRLAAYNWGVGYLDRSIRKYKGEWFQHAPIETQDYVKKYSKTNESFEDLFKPLDDEDKLKRWPPVKIVLSKTSQYFSQPNIRNQVKTFTIDSFPGNTEPSEVGYHLGVTTYKIHYIKSGGGSWVIDLDREDNILDDNDNIMDGLFKISRKKVVKESTIDFPKASLDTRVWQKVDAGWTLRRDVKQHILSVLGRYPGVNLRAIAQSIRIVGSICTNLYADDADIDVHIEPKDKTKYTIERQVQVMRWFNDNRDAINGWIGKHPIEVYLQLDPNQDLMSDGSYDMLNDVWEKGPRIVSMDYDPYEDFKGISGEIRKQVSKADELFGELKRDVIDYSVITNAIDRMPAEVKKTLLTKLTSKLKEIENDIELLYSKRKEWTKIRRNASKPSTPEQARKDIKLANKWKDTNAVFKFISRYQYMKVIKDLSDLLKDGEISPEDVKSIRKTVGVV